MCRYEQSCSADADTKTCAAPYPACRDAMVEILGTNLRTNCACSGTAGDFRELFECIEYQRLFWANPCVGEQLMQSAIPSRKVDFIFSLVPELFLHLCCCSSWAECGCVRMRLYSLKSESIKCPPRLLITKYCGREKIFVLQIRLLYMKFG